jgi:hypothetical protein
MSNNISQQLISTDLTQPLLDWLMNLQNRDTYLPGKHQSTKSYRHQRTGKGSNTWSKSHVNHYGKFWAGFPLTEFTEIKKEISRQFSLDESYFTDPIFGDMISYGEGTYMCHFHTDSNIDLSSPDPLIHTRLNVLLSKPTVGGEQVVFDSEDDCFPLEQEPRIYRVVSNQPWVMLAGLFKHGTVDMEEVIDSPPRIILSYGMYLRQSFLEDRGFITDANTKLNVGKNFPITCISDAIDESNPDASILDMTRINIIGEDMTRTSIIGDTLLNAVDPLSQQVIDTNNYVDTVVKTIKQYLS